MAGCLAELPFEQHQRQVLRHHVGNSVRLAYLHRGITCPLAAMGMQDVGLAVFPRIVIIHRAHDRHPTVHVPPYQPRDAPLIRLADGDAVHHVLVATEGQLEVSLRPDRQSQLHIAQYTHLVAQCREGLGLIQTEQASIGREEGRYLENMHLRMKE